MKPFAGIIRDVKGRLPWYKSDWTEGFNSGYRCALHHRIRPSSSSDGAPRCYFGRKQTGNVVAHAIDDADTTDTTDTVRMLATAHGAGCCCLRPHSPLSCARVCSILQHEQYTLVFSSCASSEGCWQRESVQRCVFWQCWQNAC